MKGKGSGKKNWEIITGGERTSKEKNALAKRKKRPKCPPRPELMYGHPSASLTSNCQTRPPSQAQGFAFEWGSIYVHAHTHAHTHSRTCAHTHINTHAHTCTHTQTCTSVLLTLLAVCCAFSVSLLSLDRSSAWLRLRSSICRQWGRPALPSQSVPPVLVLVKGKGGARAQQGQPGNAQSSGPALVHICTHAATVQALKWTSTHLC